MSENKSERDLVIFLRCSQKTYDDMVEKDDNTIYFILDTGRIYQGRYLVGEVNVSPQWEDLDNPDTSGEDTAVIGTARLGLMRLGRS